MRSSFFAPATTLFILVCLIPAARATAQPAPATQAAPTTPSIRLGTTIFADYTFQQQPEVKDSDGNTVNYSSFNITRAYLNVTGNISRRVAFRVTPDIVRETGVGSALNGSYTFRLKYAYGQLNLDGWLPPGSWVRLGLQQTPWNQFVQDIYRYRFQGQQFEERDGFLALADTGVSGRVALPGDYGDVHAGIYNGEGYRAAEVNDQKGFMVRGTVRPLPGHSTLHGLRVSGFIDRDAYTKDRDRSRNIVAVTFEHRYVHAGYTYLTATDRPLGASEEIESGGWSVFVTPRTSLGWEGLIRYDSVEPNNAIAAQRRKRFIGGVAYWLKPISGVTSALLLDVDNTTFDGFSPAQPTQRRIALHMLVQY
jgi:hypothetical protein